MMWQTYNRHKIKCPFCSRTETFRINTSKGLYYCHAGSCKAKGKLSDLDISFTPEHVPEVRNMFHVEQRKNKALWLWDKLTPAGAGSRTDEYLQSRGIRREYWNGVELREGPYGPLKLFAVYAFRDHSGEVIALNYSFINEHGKRERRYMGSKSKGFAMLCDESPCVVAEGLENGIIVRGKLCNSKGGLLICGDASNMIEYTREFYDKLKHYKFKLVVDADEAGRHAANVFTDKFTIMRHFKFTLFNDAVDELA